MIVGLVVIFGAVVGLICFGIKGSGFGMWWDIVLGIAGSIIGSFIMTAAYVFNQLGKADNIGFNWYSMTVEIVGALVVIYGAWFYNRAKSNLVK